ncbi:MAG: ATP-grasp domain-containing protein, partial [Planctomycetota bacterium]
VLLRRALAAALPEANVRAEPLPWSLRNRRSRDPQALDAAVRAVGLAWPRFCKPVKASFSVLARVVADAEALAAHQRLPWFDRVLLQQQDRPWGELAARVLPLPCPPDRLLLEEPLQGRQVNVDGYVERGAIHVLGIVDECMYPGTVAGARHFAGFTFPSRQPAAVQQRAIAAATAAVRAVGYDHGVFNVELFVLADGSVRVIEVNPRAAGQFATLYRDVAGIDVQRLGIRLAAGLPIEMTQEPRVAGVGASFVFRRFDGRPAPEPTPEARAWLAQRHPRSVLWTEPCSRAALRREYRWVGSHRHAVWNHTAADFATLFRDGEEVAQRLFAVPMPAGLREHEPGGPQS